MISGRWWDIRSIWDRSKLPQLLDLERPIERERRPIGRGDQPRPPGCQREPKLELEVKDIVNQVLAGLSGLERCIDIHMICIPYKCWQVLLPPSDSW